MRLTTMNICLIAIIVLCAGIILYLFMKKPDEGYRAGTENVPVVNPEAVNVPPNPTSSTASVAAPPDASNVPALVLFHADWCPHCKHMLPTWEDVKRAVNGKFLIIDIESKNPIMAHHQLPGFPTVRFFPKGLAASSEFLEYSGDRSAKSILDFLSSCISKQQQGK